jgi:large subunit ribosomal protein L4
MTPKANKEESTQFNAAAFTALGTPRDAVALPAATFDGTVNMPVMHQDVKAILANQRQGTHATKTRRWVVGGNQKPWKQKGTGRARAGSTRSPVWVGGGTVFGPTPRGYEQKVPRQVKALARKSAFNARAREESVIVIDRFAYDAPKTSMLVQLLARLDVSHKKVLLLTDGVKTNVVLSGRNLPNVVVLPYSDASTYDLLWSDVVLVEAPALGHTLAPVAEKAMDKLKLKKPASKKSAKAEKAADMSKAKTTKKRTAKAEKAKAAKSPAKKPAAKAAAKKSAPKAAAKKPAAKKAAPKKKGK